MISFIGGNCIWNESHTWTSCGLIEVKLALIIASACKLEKFSVIKANLIPITTVHVYMIHFTCNFHQWFLLSWDCIDPLNWPAQYSVASKLSGLECRSHQCCEVKGLITVEALNFSGLQLQAIGNQAIFGRKKSGHKGTHKIPHPACGGKIQFYSVEHRGQDNMEKIFSKELRFCQSCCLSKTKSNHYFWSQVMQFIPQKEMV